MRLQTYQLRLVPDPIVPRFSILNCSTVDVSVEDVFHHGIHPHSATTALHGDTWGASDAILDRLNAPEAKVPDLETHGVGYTIIKPSTPSFSGQAHVKLERLLHEIATSVWFVPDLAYDDIRNIAVQQLRGIWSHSVARDMLRSTGHDFASIRAFVKAASPAVKLTGFQSLDEYDMARVLNVDHFLTEDRLLLEHGLARSNWRRADTLARITDGAGRLRLRPRISRCVVEWHPDKDERSDGIRFHCDVTGDRISWHPVLTADERMREQVRHVARQLAGRSGRYCFVTRICDLERALDDPCYRVRFPWLQCQSAAKETKTCATAQVRTETITTYRVATNLHSGRNNDVLQDVLRDHGLRTTGRKDELVRRIAEMLAREYTAATPTLDRFFAEHRFVRLTRGETRTFRPFPVLEDRALGRVLVAMYCLSHLRGNVILDPSHHNAAVEPFELAEALLNRRVALDGNFVEAL